MGVALVASAAKGLTKNTCKEKLTMSINAAAAVITYYVRVARWASPCLYACSCGHPDVAGRSIANSGSALISTASA